MSEVILINFTSHFKTVADFMGESIKCWGHSVRGHRPYVISQASICVVDAKGWTVGWELVALGPTSGVAAGDQQDDVERKK